MSRPNGEAVVVEDLDQQRVVDYLLAHPDLLLQQPDLLGQLELHHHSGDAVSLIERQVRALREQVERYQRQLGELVAVARDNEQVNQRLHKLTLELITALDPDEVRQILDQRLRDDFQAHGVALHLNKEILADPDFATLLNRRRVFCGRLTKGQLKTLFSDQAQGIRSVAVIALHNESLSGVLAIGSTDESRFHPGIGTDYLQRLGEIIARTLEVVSEPGL